MIKILHNNTCSKSNAALRLLETSGKAFKIVDYIRNPLSTAELQVLFKKLNMRPIDAVRKNEAIYQSQFADSDFTDAEWISNIAQYPVLLERPIVINADIAVVCRPPDRVLEVI